MEKVLNVFQRLQYALSCCDFPTFCFKPRQVLCFEKLLNGMDVIAVLPTGYGKSVLYQLLPLFLPTKKTSNIVIVISPLNSIIEDQTIALNKIGIPCDSLKVKMETYICDELFSDEENQEQQDEQTLTISLKILHGKASVLFAHPEAALSESGRKLFRSDIYQNNVVACVIDEAHCIEMW